MSKMITVETRTPAFSMYCGSLLSSTLRLGMEVVAGLATICIISSSAPLEEPSFEWQSMEEYFDPYGHTHEKALDFTSEYMNHFLDNTDSDLGTLIGKMKPHQKLITNNTQLK